MFFFFWKIKSKKHWGFLSIVTQGCFPILGERARGWEKNRTAWGALHAHRRVVGEGQARRAAEYRARLASRVGHET